MPNALIGSKGPRLWSCLFICAIGSALAPARADLPAECKTALGEAAKPANNYMCFANQGSNACHQTSTRAMAIFLAKTDKTKSARTNQRTKIESVANLYQEVCGRPIDGPSTLTTCTPKSTSVYQLFISDSHDPQGHSFVLACLANQGCVVVQGIAGAFGLHHWIGQKPSAKQAVVQAVAEYGNLKVLKDESLHGWLLGARDVVVGRGTLLSVLAFGVCDKSYYGCDRIGQQGWKKMTWAAPTPQRGEAPAKSDIVGFKYPWDGTCAPFADSRKAGADYVSPYCTNDGVFRYKMPYVETNLADRNGLCVMGLDAEGKVPASSDESECLASGPMDATARFEGWGTVTAIGKVTTVQLDPLKITEVGTERTGSKRITACITWKQPTWYEFERPPNRPNDAVFTFTGPVIPGIQVKARLHVTCRIAGDSGKQGVVRAPPPQTGPKPQSTISFTDKEKETLTAMKVDAKFCDGNTMKEPRAGRRNRIDGLAKKLGLAPINDRTSSDYPRLQAEVLKAAEPYLQ
jgi:hypothetical protein